MNKQILIGGAWPYANGSLHIGHIAGLLPGDVIARYYRANGDDVYYVSGSDCHGTPITIRAKQEGKTPEEISDIYHREFKIVLINLVLVMIYMEELLKLSILSMCRNFTRNFTSLIMSMKNRYRKHIVNNVISFCRIDL